MFRCLGPVIRPEETCESDPGFYLISANLLDFTFAEMLGQKAEIEEEDEFEDDYD